MAFPFIVRQRDMPARTIVLQGRSLPYRGVAWGGRQAIDLNWMPGNPVASSQIIGGQLKPTSIIGKWKDVFLASEQNRGILANFPKLQSVARPDADVRGGNVFSAAGSVPAQYAERAIALREAFEMLREESVLLKVEWGTLVRYGHITDTNFPHDREEDIDYEIEFSWLGKTDSQPKPKLKAPDLLSLLKKILALLDEVINALLIVVFEAQMFLTKITQGINKLGSFVTELLGALEKISSFVFAPADILGTIKSNLVAIQLAALDLFRTMQEGSASLEASATGNPLAVSRAQTWEQTLRDRIQRLASEAARQEAQVEELLVPELLGVIAMPAGKTLRDVSIENFGTPDNWRAIADFNGFGGSLVPRGTVVRIPSV